jgi:cell division protease FtsH
LQTKLNGEISLNDTIKNIFLWLIIAAILMSIFQNFGPSEPDKMINYSTFVQDVQRGDVESIVVKGSVIEGLRKDRTALKQQDPPFLMMA